MPSHYAQIGAARGQDPSDVVTARRSQVSSQGRFAEGEARVCDRTLVQGRAVSCFLGTGGDMSGYTPDEKLRLQQLRELRRRWLKDQELSPRGTHAAPSGGGGGGGAYGAILE